ncbi:ankyrin repeat-containing protein At5g02620-like [Elaeis guineensis]|uniref:ankyrin repeat-containing protein At5g02620-like n=1 Tax=Elaeis guineensis var. tenera TaxID=51953 RepID=UPI003C6D6363
MGGMEKQQSFHVGALEELRSFRLGAMEKQKSFRLGVMEKQKSVRRGSMEKQQSFHEKKRKDGFRKRGDTPLHLAARAGNMVHAMKILLDCSDSHLKDLISKQNQDGETALYIAAEMGHIGVVREILSVSDVQSASLKATNNFDAFHIAARKGHLEVLKVFLHSFPALAMTTDSSNSTALYTAATQGHTNVVDLLLETDASLAKIARSNGKTALHSAARMGHVEVVKSLLREDPSLGLRTDKKGQTAIHMAVKGHSVEIVLELLRTYPSVASLEDNKGNTPLHIATRKGRHEIMQALLSVDGIKVNAVNRAGETALSIAEKSCDGKIMAFLKEVGAVAAKKHPNPPNAAKQLKQTVSDIKHEVQFQLLQTRRTEIRVQNIKKKLQKLHRGGLNNAINSNTVVAVLIAAVAFAAIFTVPGQYVETPTDGSTLGQVYIAENAAFIVFLVFDSLALFIALAVVVVQTSLIVIEEKAKRLMVFVINKLMWLACLFISASFMSLCYVVVGRQGYWLAWVTTVIGALIMLTTLGSMCYFMIIHRIERKNLTNIRRASGSRTLSWSMSAASESEMLKNEYKMYAL